MNRHISNEDLRAVETMEDALELCKRVNGDVKDFGEWHRARIADKAWRKTVAEKARERSKRQAREVSAQSKRRERS